MAMTFDGQRSGSMSVELEDWAVCKEEVSASLLGKLVLPCLCYKHIPSNNGLIPVCNNHTHRPHTTESIYTQKKHTQ